MKGTIYKIQSKINNKIYIGMTTRDVTVRWYEHRAELKRNSHHNIKLQRHYNKYGDVFDYSVIDVLEFTGEEILDIESKYIKLFNTVKDGFNLSEGGRGCLGYIGKDRIFTNGQAQYIKNVSYFKIYEYYKLADKFNSKKETIINIAKDKSYRNIKVKFDSYDEYMWYKEEAEKYRLSEYGEKINNLYLYYKDNPDIIEVPRSQRAKLRPESIQHSLLKDDYKYKDKCFYILERVKSDKAKKEERKKNECQKALTAMLKYGNYQQASESTGINIDKIRRIKAGSIYGKYCSELREKVSKIAIFKTPPPNREEFEAYILTHTYSDAEKKYNVSRPTLKRWVSFFGIEKKLEYYNPNKPNPNSKVVASEVKSIRADYKNLGLTYKELSDKYGMSISHIHRIITYKIYKSIK